jgi:site-specific DNA recombinase
MTLAALYARVSSERQKEDQTIASQTAALKEHAAASGLEVPAEWIFEDEGYSGATLVRPGLERLRDLAAQVEVEVILCYSPDRLARKYAYQALLMEEFARVGTEVRFVKGPKADTPEDELLLQFQGMIAEYEKAQIAERTRRGKLHRAKAGSINVLGGAPYGYRYVRKTEDAEARYEIVEAHAAVVRDVFRLYTDEQLSIGDLCRWLGEQRIPTATGKSQWDRSTVWGMLKNPAYKGLAAFQKTISLGTRPKLIRQVRRKGKDVSRFTATKDRPPEEWIGVPVPALVSEETFALAAARLEANKRFATRNTKVPSLLQGILICQDCGYSYCRTSTTTSSRKIYYYRCLGSDDWRYEHGRVCQARPIRQDYLDQVVWEHVTALLADPDLIRHELDRRLEELRSVNPATAEKSRLELELSRTTTAMSRLLEAYQEELLSLEELRRRMPDLRKKESGMRSQLDALESRLLNEESYLKLAEDLQSFIGRLQNAAEASTIEERQKILRLVVKEVLVGAERVVIRHSIPSTRPDPPGYPLRGRTRESALRPHGPGCAGRRPLAGGRRLWGPQPLSPADGRSRSAA